MTSPTASRLPTPHLARAARFILAAATTLLSVACSDEATTPNCPDLPLYDVSNPASLTQDVIRRRAEAVNAGCMTAIGTAAGNGGGGTGGSDRSR